MEVRRLCASKEEIYAKLIGNHKPPVVPGVPTFLETLVKHNVSTLQCLLAFGWVMCSAFSPALLSTLCTIPREWDTPCGTVVGVPHQ